MQTLRKTNAWQEVWEWCCIYINLGPLPSEKVDTNTQKISARQGQSGELYSNIARSKFAVYVNGP